MMHHPAQRRAIGARPQHRRLAPFWLALTAAGALTAATPMADASAAVANVTVTSHFVWKATAANSSGDSTFINNFATNGRPGDLLFITPNRTQGGVCGSDTSSVCVDDTSPVGVWYDTSTGRWAIFNEDRSAIPAGASFNVLVVPAASSSVFVQTATAGNSSGDFTYINSPHTNGLPGTMLMITPVWNPGGTGGTFNNHATGVWYDNSKRQWAILNEDKAGMTANASFNVMVGTSNSGGGTSALQTATATNTTGNITFISNSLTTGDPNAIVFETPNGNPGGAGGTYDPAAPGTYWSGTNGKAAIYNENKLAMPLHAAFNLIIYQS
jgi:hypothetical protein